MTDFTIPFDDRDAEGLTQILAAFEGTFPEAMDIVRKTIAENPAYRDRAIAAMHKWRGA